MCVVVWKTHKVHVLPQNLRTTQPNSSKPHGDVLAELADACPPMEESKRPGPPPSDFFHEMALAGAPFGELLSMVYEGSYGQQQRLAMLRSLRMCMDKGKLNYGSCSEHEVRSRLLGALRMFTRNASVEYGALLSREQTEARDTRPPVGSGGMLMGPHHPMFGSHGANRDHGRIGVPRHDPIGPPSANDGQPDHDHLPPPGGAPPDMFD